MLDRMSDDEFGRVANELHDLCQAIGEYFGLKAHMLQKYHRPRLDILEVFASDLDDEVVRVIECHPYGPQILASGPDRATVVYFATKAMIDVYLHLSSSENDVEVAS